MRGRRPARAVESDYAGFAGLNYSLYKSTKPTWTHIVVGLEETVPLALMTPPSGPSYTLLNSSGDIGMNVNTELDKTPTRGPRG